MFKLNKQYLLSLYTTAKVLNSLYLKRDHQLIQPNNRVKLNPYFSEPLFSETAARENKIDVIFVWLFCKFCIIETWNVWVKIVSVWIPYRLKSYAQLNSSCNDICLVFHEILEIWLPADTSLSYQFCKLAGVEIVCHTSNPVQPFWWLQCSHFVLLIVHFNTFFFYIFNILIKYDKF